MKILFTGGGSLGPVTPLLAVAEQWKKQDASVRFIWVGTTYGPEKAFMKKESIPFFSLPTARFTRYVSWEWLWFPWRFFSALVLSWKILKKEQPDLIASAGGFTSVPIILVGTWLNIPSWIHQQDAVPLLTTKLLVPFVSLITVAWSSLLASFPKQKTEFVGNPVRFSLQQTDRKRAYEHFGLSKEKPTLLVIGGGGGAQWINKKITEIFSWVFTFANVIHVTGSGRRDESIKKTPKGCFVAEFFQEEMAEAFCAADVVLSRAGMGTISECIAFAKPTIFIPLPNSPQEKNVQMLQEQKAAVVLFQDKTDADKLKQTIKELFEEKTKRETLANNIRNIFPTDISSQLVARLLLLVQEAKRKTSG